MHLTKLCCSQPAVAGTAFTPLVPRSVTAGPNNGVKFQKEYRKMSIGQRFSLLYLNRDEPARDSQRFRNRLDGFYMSNLHKNHKDEIKKILQAEAGIEVPYLHNFGFNISGVFKKNELRDVLDCITLIYRTLKLRKYLTLSSDWKEFVARALREENVGYQLDAECGVHYFVDEEFERNRFSTLTALNNPEHLGVKGAYEDAYRHLDNTPPDTKAAARSIFEALEILTKQLVKTKSLNKWVLENSLKELAIETLAQDETQKLVIAEMFDGFGRWVDGMHNYRHGQPQVEPVAPSEELVVYMLSSGSSFLRLLLEIWKKI